MRFAAGAAEIGCSLFCLTSACSSRNGRSARGGKEWAAPAFRESKQTDENDSAGETFSVHAARESEGDCSVIKRFGFVVIVGMLSLLALGQGNGKLQIHFMDVGQGDGAVLISPQGQVVPL